MKQITALKAILIFDLNMLRRILFEIFFLTGLLIASFFFFISGIELYIFSFAMIYMLSSFFVLASVMYLKTERDKGAVLKVYKTLPLNNSQIYISNLFTPLVLFLILNYIPTLILTVIFKNTIIPVLLTEQISFSRFIYLAHFLSAIITMLLIFIYINSMIFLGDKIKSFLSYTFFLLAIVYTLKLNIKFNLNMDMTKIKDFFIKSGSIYYFHLASLILIIVLIFFILLGMKKYCKKIYSEL